MMTVKLYGGGIRHCIFRAEAGSRRHKIAVPWITARESVFCWPTWQRGTSTSTGGLQVSSLSVNICSSWLQKAVILQSLFFKPKKFAFSPFFPEMCNDIKVVILKTNSWGVLFKIEFLCHKILILGHNVAMTWNLHQQQGFNFNSKSKEVVIFYATLRLLFNHTFYFAIIKIQHFTKVVNLCQSQFYER